MDKQLNDQNNNRYMKQIKVSQIGTNGQQQISEFRCAIVGLGALGSVIAEQLTRAGFGYIRIIDRDFVEWSNLQRQTLYTEQDAIDMLPKAVAAKNYLQRVNSEITIDAIVADVSATNINSLLDGLDVIFDGSDNFAVRFLINEFSVVTNTPWIHGAVVGATGTTATFIPNKTPCYACIFPVEPQFGATDTCDTAGVISPVVHMISSIQVTEAMKLATQHYDDLHQSFIQLDCWHNEQLKLDISTSKRSDCAICHHHQYHYLDGEYNAIQSSSLCGRNSVQVHTNSISVPTLQELQQFYENQYEITTNRYLLKIKYDSDITVVFFTDCRAIVQGTEDIMKAESIVSLLLQK